MISPLSSRSGSANDQEWLYSLFRNTMKEQIDQAWGWDELFQREGFIETLPVKQFRILEIADRPVAAYFVKQNGKRLELEMILVEPNKQRTGLGSQMMSEIKQQARSNQLPIKLRVLKDNPAREFHRSMGFKEAGSDEYSVTMHWQPDSELQSSAT